MLRKRLLLPLATLTAVSVYAAPYVGPDHHRRMAKCESGASPRAKTRYARPKDDGTFGDGSRQADLQQRKAAALRRLHSQDREADRRGARSRRYVDLHDACHRSL